MVKTFNIFSRTEIPMILILGIQHRELKLYKVYIKSDPGLTLTYFTARSNLVACTFECENLTKELIGKILQRTTKFTGDLYF